MTYAAAGPQLFAEPYRLERRTEYRADLNDEPAAHADARAAAPADARTVLPADARASWRMYPTYGDYYRTQPGQKYHPFHRDSVKINDLLLTFASKFLLQIARFQLSRGVMDDEKSLSAGWWMITKLI